MASDDMFINIAGLGMAPRAGGAAAPARHHDERPKAKRAKAGRRGQGGSQGSNAALPAASAAASAADARAPKKGKKAKKAATAASPMAAATEGGRKATRAAAEVAASGAQAEVAAALAAVSSSAPVAHVGKKAKKDRRGKDGQEKVRARDTKKKGLKKQFKKTLRAEEAEAAASTEYKVDDHFANEGQAERKLVVAGSKLKQGSSLQELPVDEKLKRQLSFLGFEKCTPIQALAVPAALSSADVPGAKKRKRGSSAGLPSCRDVLLRAPTGSGKTLAFLLPVLNQIIELGCNRDDGTIAVVLSPTKELSLQTAKVAGQLLRMVPSAVVTTLAGGEKPKSEKARLRKGAALICATPGRLTYHLEHTATFKVTGLRCLVLDEADRLLDMGFERQVKQIVHKLRSGGGLEEFGVAPKAPLQTLLASATLSPAVRKLAAFCLREGAFWADPQTNAESQGKPMTEDVNDEVAYEVPDSLTQWYLKVPLKERLPALLATLASKASGGKKAIVFFSSNASVDFHHDLMVEAHWPTRAGNVKKPKDAPPQQRKYAGGFVGVAGQGEEDLDEDMDGENDEDEEEEQEGQEESEQKVVAGTAKILKDVPIFKLHGNLTAEERAGYIEDFVKAPCGALLASDAASRGLDFPQIDWSIQYDPPQRTEEYLHRVGRTARIGRAGNALLFLSPSELGFIDHLQDKGVSNIQELSAKSLHSELMRTAPRELHFARDAPSLISAGLKNEVEENEPLLRLARTAFLSATRAYRAFPRELRACFPYEELHPGKFASSFGLRETPKGIARTEKRDLGILPSSGRGRGKGGGRGSQGSGRGSRGSGRGSRDPSAGGVPEGGWGGNAGGAPVKRGQLGGAAGSRVDRRAMGGGGGDDEFAC